MNPQLPVVFVASARENTATECAAARQTIDPCNRVVMGCLALGGEGEELREVAKRDRLDIHAGTGDRQEFQRDPRNDPRQPEPSYRRSEGASGVVWRERTLSAIAAHHIEPANPSADRPGTMMVLAMDIVGYRSAERHEFRAGRNRQEIAGRDYNFQNVCQADAG